MAVLINHSGRAASLSAARETGQKVPHRQPRKQRHDEPRFARKPQRPGDSHRPALVRRLGDIRVVTNDPAENADPINDGERRHKLS